MRCHQTLTGIQKQFHKKINIAPCKIFYIANITTFPKSSTVDTNHLQPAKIIHMYFAFYNMTPIIGFTPMITFVYKNTIIICVFPTAPKQLHFHTITFSLTILKNEQNTWKLERVNEYGALEKSTNVTNLLVDELSITMEATGGDVLWINVNIERKNISIDTMVRSGIIENNQHENKWYCEAETLAQVYVWNIHSSLDNN